MCTCEQHKVGKSAQNGQLFNFIGTRQ